VGLGFEPVDREDGRIDIVGTVWIDTLSRVLRDMDFHYVGLDPQITALSPAGRLSFRELSNGVVIIDQWSLRLGVERRAPGRTLVGRTPVPASHQVVRLILEDGRVVRASPGHPLADGRPLGTIRVGDRVDGATVTSASLEAYDGGFTFDLLPDGPTGIYLADGVPLGSTLRGG